LPVNLLSFKERSGQKADCIECRTQGIDKKLSALLFQINQIFA